MGDLLTDEEEKIFDRKMSVLAYITFGFNNEDISKLLNVTKDSISKYKKQFDTLGWIVIKGNTRSQVTKLTESGEEVLENYDGIIY